MRRKTGASELFVGACVKVPRVGNFAVEKVLSCLARDDFHGFFFRAVSLRGVGFGNRSDGNVVMLQGTFWDLENDVVKKDSVIQNEV